MKVLTPFSWTETEGVRDEGEGGVAVEGGTLWEKEGVGLGEDSGRSGKRALERVAEDEEVGAAGDGGGVSGEGVGRKSVISDPEPWKASAGEEEERKVEGGKGEEVGESREGEEAGSNKSGLMGSMSGAGLGGW